MKRIIPSLIALSLTIGFASCNSCGNKEVKETAEDVAVIDTTKKKASTVVEIPRDMPPQSLEEVLHPDSIAADTASSAVPGGSWEYWDKKVYNDDPEYVQKAKELIKEAKYTKDADKLFQLACFYDFGLGMPENNKMSIVYYAKAAAMGHAKALYNLATWYSGGGAWWNGLCKYWKSEALYTHAALKGCIVNIGRVVKDKQDEYFKILTTHAQNGNAEAQYLIGYYYREGIVVEKDTITGNMWWDKAVAQGYLDENDWVLSCGHDKWPNIKDCITAAHAGNADAQFYLGLCYYMGNTAIPEIYSRLGLEDSPDYRRQATLQWWFRTSELRWDDLDARRAEEKFNRQLRDEDDDHSLSFGAAFKRDKIIKRDDAEAVKWFKQAAEQGHEDAKNFLGNCYYLGAGVPRDHKKAIKLWKENKDFDYWGGNSLVTYLMNKK